MPISTTENRVQYNGNGSNTSFAIPFVFQDNSWIKVILTSSDGVDTNWTEGVNYTLTGATVASGGTLTALIAPETGTRLTIYREAPYTQINSYQYNDAFPSQVTEDTVDKNTVLIQQVREIADKLAIKFPQSEPTATIPTLPDVSTRQGKYLFFASSTGFPTVGIPTGIGVTLLDEDDMISDSDQDGATQQSIKAYVDNNNDPAQNNEAVKRTVTDTTPTNIPQWGANDGELTDGLTFSDDDTLGSAASDDVASSESLKAYIDSQIALKGFQTGDIVAAGSNSTRTGFVRLNGLTIGNASSGATERANADTEALFAFLWDNYSDTNAPVSSGRGASASADYAANKTITLPDARNRSLAFIDGMGNSNTSRITNADSGVDGTDIGASGGVDSQDLTKAQLPADPVTGTNAASSISGSAQVDAATITASIFSDGAGGAGDEIIYNNSAGGAGFNSVSIQMPAQSVNTSGLTAAAQAFTGGAMGSGEDHNNLQPTLIIGSALMKL